MGSCLVSTVFRHVRSTQKEHINVHKVVTEQFRVAEKKGDHLAVHRVPREWVLLEYYYNVNDE